MVRRSIPATPLLLVWLSSCDAGSIAEESGVQKAVSTPASEQPRRRDPRWPVNARPAAKEYPRGLRIDWTADVGKEPLGGAAESLDALGRSIVEALNTNDREALIAIAVNRQEYETRLFPALATSPNALRTGAGHSWMIMSIESNGDLTSALKDYGGRNWTFVRLEPLVVEPRPGLMLYRNPKVVVRDPQGEEHKLVMLGPVVEHRASGGFKVIAYRDTAF